MNSRGNKFIDGSSHYVCSEFAVAMNGLILLGKVDRHTHFAHVNADVAIGRSPCRKFFNKNLLFILNEMCVLWIRLRVGLLFEHAVYRCIGYVKSQVRRI